MLGARHLLPITASSENRGSTNCEIVSAVARAARLRRTFRPLTTQTPYVDARIDVPSGGARRRRRRRPPTASRLKGPRKQKSLLLKRGLANLMSPTSTSGVAPPLDVPHQTQC
ncbi:hypothetical protein EVAR_59411_1 [Eumeta japonica]|uniref:Uncharacterized protein n=1 Tax=Eumeta variegata TaxID=151549 RepID=A0A4C1Z3H6_EUMVA|nr:hypothetical protein EVAR_59411_1 [Eumeta japonica]